MREEAKWNVFKHYPKLTRGADQKYEKLHFEYLIWEPNLGRPNMEDKC